MTASPRALVIGIDGGDFATLDPLVERGLLPHLAGLLRASASSVTTTTWPAHTAPGWSTLVSASRPGGHGIYQFYDTQDAAYGARLTLSGDLGRTSVWDWLAGQGYTLGLVNIPMSHPAADLPGYQITWPLSQSLRYCRPVGLLGELAKSGVHFQSDLATMFRGDLGYLEEAEENVGHRVATVRRLIETRPTDVVMVVLTEVDRVGHHYWHFGDEAHPQHVEPPAESGWDKALERVYRRVDDAVGELLSLVDEDTEVVLVSDHGLGLGRWGLALNQVLAEAGLLATRPAQDSQRTASWFTEGALSVDFARTRIYQPVPGSYGLNVNLEGRQLGGFVTPGDRAAVLADAAAVCAGLRTPDGLPVFRAVVPREQAYPGPHRDRAPDLLLVPQDETVIPIPALEGPLWRPSVQTGLHRHQGIWAHRSPQLIPGRRAGTLPLTDVVPTLLAALGATWPGDVHGCARLDFFANPSASVSRRVPPIATLPEPADGPNPFDLGGNGAEPDRSASDAAEDEYTSERLREMGYL